jgi:CRISPR-associated protein (TIGR02710 family)
MHQHEFDEAIQQWSEQPRTEKADFYDLLLWPEVRQRFAQLPAPPQSYDVLIIPVSNPHTAILHLDRYRPQTVVFLFSERSFTDHAPRLRQEAEHLGITYDDNDGLIDATDTLSVYRAVKHAYERYPGQRIAVDITGGTKAMSVGVAMAGSVIGADSIYIESRFDKDIQDRLPGSEQPDRLPDPYTTLGDIQRQRAFGFYAGHDYGTAQELFRELARRVQPPQGDAAWATLAAAYAAWDSFDLHQAEKKLGQVRETSDLPAPLDAVCSHLDAQVNALQRVQKLVAARRPDREDAATWYGKRSFAAALNVFIPQQIRYLTAQHVAPTLLAMFYANALRREAQQRLDTAALLLYRCLELMSQQRLARQGILTEFPRDGIVAVRARVPDLDARYAAALRAVHPDGRTEFPTGKLTLFDGYILLCALADPFATQCDIARIQDQADARNQSILAHGFTFITKREYQAFKRTVDTVIGYWCAVEQLDWSVYLETCTFVGVEQQP